MKTMPVLRYLRRRVYAFISIILLLIVPNAVVGGKLLTPEAPLLDESSEREGGTIKSSARNNLNLSQQSDSHAQELDDTATLTSTNKQNKKIGEADETQLLVDNQSSIANNYTTSNTVIESSSYRRKLQRISTKIIGGRDARRGRFPYFVALFDKRMNLICGGSLIASDVVLSAAHCQ